MPRRTRKGRSRQPDAPAEMRCAIYTRKSTSEGLDQAFNSLDAQREAGEAYVASQKHQGWTALPERYDDGGFSGGTIERPGIQKLMEDIETGGIDCVVVYKVDRLSRSLMDFARIMRLFEEKNVHFVSVTQHFNTAESMGRLTLNILLSFAQFEREIISERTRDKIAAARRRGQWSGGHPILGYDVGEDRKLAINEEEAQRARGVFEIYLRRESLIKTADEANRRGWRTKQWTTRKGDQRGGRRFDKAIVHNLLTNVLYIGKVRYKDEVHEGQHQAIVDQDVWDRVQAMLARNYRTAGALTRNKHGALLKGILRCGHCRAAMIHSVSVKGVRRYRYYVCTRAQKRGHAHCPTGTVNAESLEVAVVSKLRQLPVDASRLTTAEIPEAAVLFGAGWAGTNLAGRARVIRLLLYGVEYHGGTKTLGIGLSEAAAACVRASA